MEANYRTPYEHRSITKLPAQLVQRRREEGDRGVEIRRLRKGNVVSCPVLSVVRFAMMLGLLRFGKKVLS